MKLMKGFLLGTFVAGIFMANLMGREAVSNAGVLNDYFVEKFRYIGINAENLLFYIVEERMPLMILMMFLLFSALGVAAGLLALGWQGFSIGFMLSTGIAKYGVKGILLVLGGLFPQYLCYLPVYVCYFYLAVSLRQRLSGAYQMEKKRAYGLGALGAVMLMGIFVTGIFLESYINPIILKNILNFF
ncbi:stage II sporulation protein M [Lachnospiraceae bacterium 29-84]